jgi:mannosyltransferase OCH1-like enzyme
MPQEFEDYRESWRRHHPDWEMRLWTDDNLPTDLVRKEAYERLRKGADRSDIIRPDLLHRFGGVYLDTDFECFRSIEPLLEGIELFSAQHPDGRVNGAIMGGVPGHPVLERVLHEMRPVTDYGNPKAYKWGAGPYFLNKLLRQHPEVTIFSHEYFYPDTPDERQRAYADHHGTLSWKDPEELRRGFVDAQRALGEARRRIEELERRRWKNRILRVLRASRSMLTPRSA